VGTRANGRTEPWVPDRVTVLPIARRTTRARATGKERPCWDVRWRVDGDEYQRRFLRAADANVFADGLHAGHRRGMPFDPVAKRFTRPEQLPEPRQDTVFSWTAEFWAQKWAALEPKSRSELARYLNRARSFFVSSPPTGADATVVSDYLSKASLAVASAPLTESQAVGERWLRDHSLPLESVDRDAAVAMLTHYRDSRRNPGRQTAPTTERRMVADLKQCWKHAVLEGRVDANPWDAVVLRTRTSRANVRSGELAADAEMVLSPDQVIELAERCVTEGSWGEHVRCFVLVMGLCGLRPREAVGLLVGDVELPPAGHGWLTIRRTHRPVPLRSLDPEEDPSWGPLEGRNLAATRRVPIPSAVAAMLRQHLAEFCADAAPTDLVFEHRGKAFDLGAFGTDVWRPARASVFPFVAELDRESPLQPKLARLRRHDLRHSACSMWLRAHVDVTVCQEWSGHKRLSAFLDVYQGLIPGRQDEGVMLLEAHLAGVV